MESLPEDERRIYFDEKEFSISKVQYLKYKEAVNKTGALPDLTSDQLSLISKDINLNMLKLTKEIVSIEAVTMRDTLFTYHEAKSSYHVLELLIIGFLYCGFDKEEEHRLELWSLINPTNPD